MNGTTFQTYLLMHGEIFHYVHKSHCSQKPTVLFFVEKGYSDCGRPPVVHCLGMGIHLNNPARKPPVDNHLKAGQTQLPCGLINVNLLKTTRLNKLQSVHSHHLVWMGDSIDFSHSACSAEQERSLYVWTA